MIFTRKSGPTPLQVEFVLPSLVVGGMEKVTLDLAVELKRLGIDVGITCTTHLGPLSQQCEESGLRVSLVRFRSLAATGVPWPLVRHFLSLRPDVVHSNSGVWLPVSVASRFLPSALHVHTVHGLLDREERKDRVVKRLAAAMTDRVVAVSDPLRDYLTTSVGLRNSRVSVIPNGVDTRRFAPRPRSGWLRRSLGLSSSDRIVGIVARLVPVKDHKTLLHALSHVKMSGHAVHLVIAGDGPLLGELTALASSLHLAQHTHFLGAVEDPAALYPELDVFALSSLAEGTSISILEALASGVPVVATDVGGNGRLLGAGQRGTLVNPEDPSDLARALISVLSNEHVRTVFGVAGRQFVEEFASIASTADAYVRLYTGTEGVSAASISESVQT